jgi:hypothetical protein
MKCTGQLGEVQEQQGAQVDNLGGFIIFLGCELKTSFPSSNLQKK